jgi:nitric oxide reductase large subunit
MNVPPPLSPVKRKGSFLRTAKLVLWSFVGLRARNESELDVEQLNPVHIIVMGLMGVGVFVGALIALATWVVSG